MKIAAKVDAVDLEYFKTDIEPLLDHPLVEFIGEIAEAQKCAFDAKQLLNPGKVFPTLHRCAEFGRMHVHGGQLAFPDIPRF